ncbi:MAG: asparagine synthase-related protein, partial [Planctomycetota bacterium]
CPILDHVFMEHVARFPWQSKIAGWDKKGILKRALKKHLPDDILHRKKMGFGVPILEWLRSDVRDYARELVLEGEGTRRFFQRPYLEKIWQQHQASRRNWSTELWCVMMFNLWHRRFVESPLEVSVNAS